MAKAIEDAIAALKPVSTVSGDESSDAVSDTSSAGDEPSDTPSTGDAANVLLWGGLLVARYARRRAGLPQSKAVIAEA